MCLSSTTDRLLTGSRTPEDGYQKLVQDLGFTASALKRYPKVYWIWNHRRWCLENMPDGPGTDHDNKSDGAIDGWRISVWTQETHLVEKMLALDERNCEFLSQTATVGLGSTLDVYHTATSSGVELSTIHTLSLPAVPSSE